MTSFGEGSHIYSWCWPAVDKGFTLRAGVDQLLDKDLTFRADVDQL